MAFKLYTDKSSLDRKYSRMSIGGTTDAISDRFLGWWEKTEFPINQTDDVNFIITKEYEFRPDKISYYMYGREDLMWLVLQYNNIVDINEELKAGMIITVPSYQRALYSLVNQ